MVADTRPVTLLEREPALEALDAALGDAARGDGRVALVSGEAGIGKTALASALPAARGGGRCAGAPATRCSRPAARAASTTSPARGSALPALLMPGA